MVINKSGISMAQIKADAHLQEMGVV